MILADYINDISPADLALLTTYVSNYNLLWVPGPRGSAWFAATHVIQRLGLDPSHAERTVKNAIKGIVKPRPLIFLLKGDEIREYKRSLLEHHGIVVGSNRIYIINWAAVLHLMKKHRPTHITGALTYEREEDLQVDLLLLSTYTRYPLIREWTVEDTNVDTPQRTRRFDLVRHTPDNITIYELKLGELTAAEVSTTLGEKAYIQLANRHLGPHTFKFCAASIQPAAQRLLDMMPDISFISHIQLRDELYQEMLDITPAKGRWHIEERLARLPNLFPTSL